MRKAENKNLEQRTVEDLSSIPFEGPSGIICCVIEEEESQLHFDKFGLGCFYLLGFGLFAD